MYFHKFLKLLIFLQIITQNIILGLHKKTLLVNSCVYKESAFINTLHEEEWQIWAFALLAVNHYVAYTNLQ